MEVPQFLQRSAMLHEEMRCELSLEGWPVATEMRNSVALLGNWEVADEVQREMKKGKRQENQATDEPRENGI